MVNPRDILGMNARNLLYIRPHNLRKAIRLADSKLKTKKVLEAAKIPTPKLHGIFKDYRKLDKFNWEELPGNIVLKPNRGFGGEGIVVFSKKATNDKGENVWMTGGGDEWSIDDIKRHILNILDGNYSLQNIPDVAFMEEKIITHRNFRKFTYKGLPDIRVIVYNKVPVMAMMRLPTKWSKGKANLAQGAIGAGIDMATGRTTNAAVKKPVRRRITKHPDTAQDLKGLVIPYWNEVLEMSIRCQEVSGVGFLGVDIAIDEKRGPLVLELNARSGLEIQNVNLAPLASRLRRVEGLKVDSVEKGVRLAKELFGGGSDRKMEDLITKPVIGAEEEIEIISPSGKRSRVLARVDTGAGLTSIDRDLGQKLELTEIDKDVGIRSALGKERRSMTEINFTLAGEKISTKATVTDRKNMKYPVIIGRRDLQSFLVDTGRKESGATLKFDYKKVDDVITNVNQKISLLTSLKPINLQNERDKFFADKEYSPQFTYNKPSDSEMDLLLSRVNRFKLEKVKSTIGKILYRKQQETIKKVEMVKALSSPEFTKQSINLYGEPDDDTLEYAENNYQKKKKATREEKILSPKGIIRIIKERLDQIKIPYKIVVVDDLPGRIKVNTSAKSVLINVRRDAVIKKSSLLAVIAHDIETHAYRYANGLLQPYKVFSQGLAGYFSTEEGLALYREMPYRESQKFSYMALKYLATAKGLTESFRETYKYLRSKGVLPKTAFNLTYKAKRGITDTSRPGGCTRELLYLKGYLKVKEFAEKGFDLKKLYVGKVGITDLPDIEKLGSIKPPKYLPDLKS